MKALFIPCGIGMGHVSRSLAVAQKMEGDGSEVLFASYGEGYQFLKEFTSYPAVELPEIKFYGSAGELDLKHTARKSMDAPFTFLKSIYHESKIIKDFQPEVVIADSHYSVPITCKVLGVPCVLISNELKFNFKEIYPQDRKMEYLESGLERFIQDSAKLSQAIIVPDIPGSQEIPPKIKEKITYTGPLLKKDPNTMPSRDELRRNNNLDPSQRVVLATVGGSHFGAKLLKLMADAADRIRSHRIILVTGPHIDVSSQFFPSKVLVKRFLRDMLSWMKLSDLVVSLAGHTTSMELASLGVPNLMVPIENHPEQMKNALNMQSYGISRIRDMKDLTPSKLAEDINNLLESDDLRLGASTTKKKFLEYQGTEEAVNIIRCCAQG
ncbi:UDP-N-acetylglucosamine--N-acetylmuramyl-(pentapeptide) pyrophosphoryl-undecaprenol N-acetylglucosamine transferase [Methanobacterium sp. CWC-01]|uniref:UDP-N-acetylglucosamine--N-acetylmuramyl- (pentapeptide) pyrophosphoryl-undecaprenol N-acetylglucosamine transferase n=1 Tax=Methanobacterium aridiramus TaxID=2584467 RepID=UPI0025750E0A|nr:UDP-N-acetylglucosamine--N-acetylmuramyl-(pentapeptide) pyrophosphoryl-undecaprenol N-acetylglucosamine transferase [Methanobacterium sp. CWC-01]WJI10175.1 UDP-N-acetylglucosamine--N-acetylmuramyl-(pentapeptide) pyrophosphoryl-undecaprenol N-acetylglucosamine transferase [Methanobacterium sp. CWC-01]